MRSRRVDPDFVSNFEKFAPHFGRRSAELGESLCQGSSELRQLLRSDDDQSDRQDHQELCHSDAKHGAPPVITGEC
jgi:hypothetical protein